MEYNKMEHNKMKKRSQLQKNPWYLSMPGVANENIQMKKINQLQKSSWYIPGAKETYS